MDIVYLIYKNDERCGGPYKSLNIARSAITKMADCEARKVWLKNNLSTEEYLNQIIVERYKYNIREFHEVRIVK